ncbi:hypothetical protein [Brevibacillus reuszeri]|uniref:hypothetical protein n=1 Tax=Brevibacillus reuszeri TaxID=54915 RepID=UPI0013DE83A8|nr:hypothetical protein [Brevibacillus reuszeri]
MEHSFIPLFELCKQQQLEGIVLMGHYKEDGTPNIQMTMIYMTPGMEDLTAAVESISWT